VTLDEFIEQNKLRVYRTFTRPADNRSFHFRILHAEVLHEGLLKGLFGEGKTPKSAEADYVEKIKGKTIVLEAYSNLRQEIQVPLDLTI